MEVFSNQNNNVNQGRIEDFIASDETIVRKISPDTKALVFERVVKGLLFVLIWGGIDTFFLYTLISSGEAAGMLWFIIPFFAIHLLPVWLYIAGIVKAKKSASKMEYVLTDKRILFRSGIISLNVVTIDYKDIDSVNCKIGIIEKMFNVGDVIVRSHTQAIIFDDISNPYEVLKLIQQYQYQSR